MRYAVVNDEGAIVNIYAGEHPGSVPIGDDVGFGWLRRGDAWVPPHLASVDTARTWALEQLAEIEARATTITLDDGVTYGVGPESRDRWLALFRRSEIAAKAGRSIWPQTFPAADGTVVELDDLAEAEALFAELFDRANAARVQFEAVREAVEAAASVKAAVAVLRQLGG